MEYQKAAEATGDLIELLMKKDIYLQKKNRKLLMIRDQYNSIIMKYQETAETTSDLISSKIANAVRWKTLATRNNSYDGKVTKVLRSSPQKNSEITTNKHD